MRRILGAVLVLVSCWTIESNAAPQRKPAPTGTSSSSARVAVIRTKPTGKNNIRVLPLKAMHGANHLGYERALGSNFVLGVEASYMSEYQGPSMFYFHSYQGDSYRENFVGILSQYYTNFAFRGFYMEGGLAVTRSSVRSGRTQQEASGTFLYPHAGAGYRILLDFGLNFGFGGGLGYYLGETVKIPDSTRNSAYVAGRAEPRIRLDIGYAF